MSFRAQAKRTAALSIYAALAACGGPAKAAIARPTPVKLQVVETSQSGAPTRYSGSLEPAVRVDLAFRVGGYVVGLREVSTPRGKRALDKGDFVKKGTLLARVRADEYADKLATLRAQADEAAAAARLANDELGRARRLFDGDAITQAELDTKSAHADSARAQLEAAKARAEEAALALDDTALRAPMDGIVLARQVEVGSLVAPGQPAIAIADTRSVKAVFGAPQALVEKLRLGSPLQVFVGADSEKKSPDKLLDTRVTRIAPAADSNGRVFAIEAALPNADGALRPGAVVSIHVPDAASSEVLTVPLGSIVRSPRDPRGFAVFIYDGREDRAPVRLREVRLGEVVGNAVTVTEGLRAGERVVTMGATLLRDGSEAVAIR